MFLICKVEKMNHFESKQYNNTYNLLRDTLLKFTSPVSVIDSGVKEIKKIWQGLNRLSFQNHTDANRLTDNDRANICNEETYDVFKHVSDKAPCRSLTAPIINSVYVVNGTNQLHIRWSNAYGLKYRVVYYKAGERLSTATTTDTFYQTADLSPGFYTVMVEACDHSDNGVFSMPYTCMVSSYQESTLE